MRRVWPVLIPTFIALVCFVFRVPSPPDLSRFGDSPSPLFAAGVRGADHGGTPEVSGRRGYPSGRSHSTPVPPVTNGFFPNGGNGSPAAHEGEAAGPHTYAGRLSIVIDDVSAGRDGLGLLTRVDEAITFSLLIGSHRDIELGRALAEEGKEVMLHLPMEPISKKENPGPNAITVNMEDDQIGELVRRSIAQVPFAVGVNNHMGSLATSDRRVMRAVLKEVGRSGLFFLDSMTSPHSVASSVGKELGVEVVENNLFIDNTSREDDIVSSLLLAARMAKRRGYAIVIGHPSRQTAESIIKAIPVINRMGVQLVPISDVVRLKSNGIL